jgi:hypothetical protein
MLNPKYGDVYFNRGVIKAKLNNHKAALLDFNKAIQIEAAAIFILVGLFLKWL